MTRPCECGHAHNVGPCHELDSYGCPCKCPSYVCPSYVPPDSDGPDEGDPPRVERFYRRLSAQLADEYGVPAD